LGIGDWGLGIGDWGLGPIPNPQSPIPNPHVNTQLFLFKLNNNYFKFGDINFKNLYFYNLKCQNKQNKL
jgi:hypothetical protein